MGVKVFVSALLLILPLAAYAGLGDTVAETKVRYGEPLDRTIDPVKPAEEAMKFQKDGLDVIVGFYLGKVCYLNFSKVGQPLPAEEVEKLKGEQSAGLGWEANPAGTEEEKLIRADKLAIFTVKPYAFIQPVQPDTPWIISKPWLDAAVDLRKKLERDGFTTP